MRRKGSFVIHSKLINKVDIQKIAEKGSRIYKEIKDEYDPKEIGKFLAINPDNGDVFLGKTSAEALIHASKKYPKKVFYVQKIGFDTAEAVAHSFIK